MRVFNRLPGGLVALSICLAALFAGCDDQGNGDADSSALIDGGRLDGSSPADASPNDATTLDAARPDAGPPDAQVDDATASDASSTDAALTDASPADAGPPGRARRLDNMRLRWTQGAAGRGQPTTTMTGDGVRLTGGRIGP